MLSISIDLFRRSLFSKQPMRSPFSRWLVTTVLCSTLIVCVGGSDSVATLMSASSGNSSAPTAIESHHTESVDRLKLAFDSRGHAFVVWELMEGSHFDSYAIAFR
jgi:hypothetical protein